MVDFISRTYLIERLIGIGCYVLVVMFTYNGILKYGSVHLKKNLKICTIFLVILAFFFLPDEHKDLSRILQMTNGWKNMSLSEFYNSHIIDSATSMGYFYYYLCRKIPYDGALPAITAFIFYFNVFHIVKLMFNEKANKADAIAVSFLFFMAAGCFLEVISDIRNFLAFSIVVRCFCDEWINKKNLVFNIPLYVISALMHSAVIPLLAIRFIYFIIFENDLTLAKKSFIMFFMLGGIFVFASKFGYSLTRAFEKTVGFINNESYSYLWEYIIGIIQWFVVFTITRRIRKCSEYGSFDNGIKHINRMAMLILILEILMIFEYNIFHRFMLVSLLLSIPQISYYYSAQKDKKQLSSLKTMCAIIFFIVCARGNLCGYKFFIL